MVVDADQVEDVIIGFTNETVDLAQSLVIDHAGVGILVVWVQAGKRLADIYALALQVSLQLFFDEIGSLFPVHCDAPPLLKDYVQIGDIYGEKPAIE